MKTRNGLPTQKELDAICERHLFVHNPLDFYTTQGKVVFSDGRGMNEKAEAVAEEIRKHGFVVAVEKADRSRAMNGHLHIERKAAK